MTKRQVTIPPQYNFERVDIFLRVKGRLPTERGDRLTQEILDDYCRKFEDDSLIEGVVPLAYMYRLIRDGVIKPIQEALDEG